jgi:hypothetical protein
VQTSSTHEVLFIEVPQEVSGLKVIIFEGLGKHFFLKLMQLLNHSRVTSTTYTTTSTVGFIHSIIHPASRPVTKTEASSLLATSVREKN